MEQIQFMEDMILSSDLQIQYNCFDTGSVAQIRKIELKTRESCPKHNQSIKNHSYVKRQR